jgi:hypothetical protein
MLTTRPEQVQDVRGAWCFGGKITVEAPVLSTLV